MLMTTLMTHIPDSVNLSNRRRKDEVREVVVTVTLKFVGAVALTVTVAGTEQLAPVGAPVQLRDATPENPAPPMAIVKLAVLPAGTVAEAEPPEATPKPRLGLAPVPVSMTVCGDPAVLSTIVTIPVRLPTAVGANVTEI